MRIAALGILCVVACSEASPLVVVTLPLPEVAPPVAETTPPVARAEPEVGDRIFSKVRMLWIRPRPDPKAAWIGYLSLGDAVGVRGGDAAKADAGPGPTEACARWYAVEPRGYVCSGADATLDADDPDVVVLRARVAKREAPWPYAYGESTGSTVYLNVPPARRQWFREAGLPAHLERAARIRALGPGATDEDVAAIDPLLVGVDLETTGRPAPPLLLHLGPRSRTNTFEVVRGSTIAYVYDFDADGRSWVMTWDRGIIPKDRVRVYPRSTFRGVRLDADTQLPISFVRADGETVVARQLSEVPPSIARATDGRRSWIDISITRGTLVAYEGVTPVYATLISPGRGGLPTRGKPLLETASTPTGSFTVNGKFVTATMVSQANAKIVHSEVPFTQNFSGPYALHAAYWHDSWGVGKSGGCVNLSPMDARWLFAWTEPALPPGWHGERFASDDQRPRTLVVIRK